MLHPSYGELLNILNEQSVEHNAPLISSRYSVVISSSKRARQLIDGATPLVNKKSQKPLSIAVQEIYERKVTLVPLEKKQQTESI